MRTNSAPRLRTGASSAWRAAVLSVVAVSAHALGGCASTGETAPTDDERSETHAAMTSSTSDTAAPEPGTRQSPIALDDTVAVHLDELLFGYKPVATQLSHDGYAVQAKCAPGCVLRIGGAAYPLRGFHFHTPSEHQADGRAYDAEVHFVHETGDHRLVVVGAFIEARDSGRFGTLHELAERAPGPGEPAVTLPAYHPGGLLPASRDFFHYHGSLTTPPHSEIVSWYVFTEPVAARTPDIDVLRSLQGDNARELQDRAGREVMRSQ